MSIRRSRIPFSGYSVKFSPFRANLIAVASSQYFGIAGNGRISILDTASMLPVAEFGTRDACFDVAFSELSESVVAGAGGDGSVRIFDLHRPGDRPVAVLTGHTAETYSVDWNVGNKSQICSASWDRSARVWDVVSGKEIFKSTDHTGIAYEAKWNYRNSSQIASVGGDGTCRILDLRQPIGTNRINTSSEILSVDWNKYRDTVLVTGSVDRQVNVWDIRNGSVPVSCFSDHQLAVRRVRFSPFSDSLILSASYDMTVKLWSVGTMQQVDSYSHHTEFVIGIDFSNFERDLVASTSWDRTVGMWKLGGGSSLPPAQQERRRVSNI